MCLRLFLSYTLERQAHRSGLYIRPQLYPTKVEARHRHLPLLLYCLHQTHQPTPTPHNHARTYDSATPDGNGVMCSGGHDGFGYPPSTNGHTILCTRSMSTSSHLEIIIIIITHGVGTDRAGSASANADATATAANFIFGCGGVRPPSKSQRVYIGEVRRYAVRDVSVQRSAVTANCCTYRAWRHIGARTSGTLTSAIFFRALEAVLK